MKGKAIGVIAIGIVVIIGVLIAIRNFPQGDVAIPIQESTFTQSSPPSQAEQPQCDPSYPDFCIPPNTPDLDCGDIQYSNFRVLPPDRHGFDRDNDGIGCEG